MDKQGTVKTEAVKRAMDELYLESLQDSKALFEKDGTPFPAYMQAELARLEGWKLLC
jgi:hypothetical protein